MRAFKLFLIITGLLIIGLGARMTLISLKDDMKRHQETAREIQELRLIPV